jgi:hypothetical protein
VKNVVKNIQVAAYNGACTVDENRYMFWGKFQILLDQKTNVGMNFFRE